MLPQLKGITPFIWFGNWSHHQFHSTGIEFMGEDHDEPVANKLVVEGEQGKTVGLHMVGQGTSVDAMEGSRLLPQAKKGAFDPSGASLVSLDCFRTVYGAEAQHMRT